MNYSSSTHNKNYSDSRAWKSNFSKRAGLSLANSSSLFPIVANANVNMANNNFLGFNQTGSETVKSTITNKNITSAKNCVPEIQMINKFYGLIPRKFVICERIRPLTSIVLRHKSTARPKSTSETHHSSLLHDKKLRNYRQNSCSSENDADVGDEKIEENSMPSVTTRRISFEKIYRKKPKKLVQSKSVEQNGTGIGEEFLGENCKDSPGFQRVIRIDLNQMKWDEDDAKSSEGDQASTPRLAPSPMKSAAGNTLRKTISFDENVLQRDDLKLESTKKVERPSTAASSRVLPLKDEIVEKASAIPTSQNANPQNPHWTVGKSTAERRAKLQRSFSVKDSSFDGGGESESEFIKYPESLVNTGRKSLHVEVAPEIDTMISKIRNRNPKIQQDISVSNFELELSKLIIESETLLANTGQLGIQISKETEPVRNILNSMIPICQDPEDPEKIQDSNVKSLSIPKEEPKLEIPLHLAQNIEPMSQMSTSTATISAEEHAVPKTNLVENPLKSLTTSERRKLLKKSTSLPTENRTDGKFSRKPTPLHRQNSFGGGGNSLVAGIRAGAGGLSLATINRVNNNHPQKPTTNNRVSIKKPLVEITRLRPKTAPTTNQALDRRRQPLKARSGLHQGTITTATATVTTTPTTTAPKPLPQTKGTDSPKKQISWSPNSAIAKMDVGSSVTRSAKAKTGSQEFSQTGTGTANLSAKDKERDGKVPEEADNGQNNTQPVSVVVHPRASLPRRSFSLDEGALLTYSNSADLSIDSSSSSSVEASFQDSKKREQCVKIYEKMMKVGCAVRMQTILRGLMTPSEYRNFIAAAERAAVAAEEKKLAEAEANNLDAGVLENRTLAETGAEIEKAIPILT